MEEYICMAERTKARIKACNLSNNWLVDSLKALGVETDYSEVSAVFAAKRKGTKPTIILQKANEIIDIYEATFIDALYDKANSLKIGSVVGNDKVVSEVVGRLMRGIYYCIIKDTAEQKEFPGWIINGHSVNWRDDETYSSSEGSLQPITIANKTYIPVVPLPLATKLESKTDGSEWESAIYSGYLFCVDDKKLYQTEGKHIYEVTTYEDGSGTQSNEE